MKFERTVFNIDIYGEMLKINKLNANEMVTYQKELEKCKKDSDAMGVTLKMLARQGVKKVIAENMEIDHLNELVSIVCGTKLGK